jgi:hypothetical protein
MNLLNPFYWCPYLRAILLALTAYCIAACSNRSTAKKITLASADTMQQNPIVSDSSIKLYGEGETKSILIDTLRFKLPDSVNISTANLYNGIYAFTSDSLERHTHQVARNLVFLTTFEDLGQGYRTYLYAFDIANKSLIRDPVFEHDYLYSSAGIIVIDPRGDRIFTIGKSALYEKKGKIITAGSLYGVKGKYFNFIKNVYEIGELGDDMPSNTAVVAFYKSAIATHSKSVFPLPEDWWKTK